MSGYRYRAAPSVLAPRPHVMGGLAPRPQAWWFDTPWEAELYLLRVEVAGLVQRFRVVDNECLAVYRVKP